MLVNMKNTLIMPPDTAAIFVFHGNENLTHRTVQAEEAVMSKQAHCLRICDLVAVILLYFEQSSVISLQFGADDVELTCRVCVWPRIFQVFAVVPHLLISSSPI